MSAGGLSARARRVSGLNKVSQPAWLRRARASELTWSSERLLFPEIHWRASASVPAAEKLYFHFVAFSVCNKEWLYTFHQLWECDSSQTLHGLYE